MACKQNRRRKLGSLSVDHTFSQYDITQDLKDTPEFEQFEDADRAYDKDFIKKIERPILHAGGAPFPI